MTHNVEQKIEVSYTTLEYYDFGFNTFGPFLYGFISWLNGELKKENIKNIFFLARDGFMMQKAFDLLNQEEGINTQYAYFSRASLRKGLIFKSKTYQEALRYLSWSRFVSIAEILKYFGFSDEEVDTIACEYGMRSSDDIPFNDVAKDGRLEKAYNCYKKEIDNRSEKVYQNVVQYLREIRLEGKCAIVDIGWHGNMQWYLDELLVSSHIDADVYGYYVGIDALDAINARARGFLFDNENQKLRKKVLCFFGGYEKLFQSLEGSTIGYKYDNNHVEPVLQGYEYEADNRLKDNIRAWQKGALDYISKKGEFETEYCICVDLAMQLVNFGAYPDLKRLSLFYFLYNTDGDKVYYLPQKSIIKYNPRELIHALSNSVWKTGFMKAAFKIPFPYFWIYKVMRK